MFVLSFLGFYLFKQIWFFWFKSKQGKIVSVAVQPQTAFSFETPKKLSEGDLFFSNQIQQLN